VTKAFPAENGSAAACAFFGGRGIRRRFPVTFVKKLGALRRQEYDGLSA